MTCQVVPGLLWSGLAWSGLAMLSLGPPESAFPQMMWNTNKKGKKKKILKECKTTAATKYGCHLKWNRKRNNRRNKIKITTTRATTTRKGSKQTEIHFTTWFLRAGQSLLEISGEIRRGPGALKKICQRQALRAPPGCLSYEPEISASALN